MQQARRTLAHHANQDNGVTQVECATTVTLENTKPIPAVRLAVQVMKLQIQTLITQPQALLHALRVEPGNTVVDQQVPVQHAQQGRS